MPLHMPSFCQSKRYVPSFTNPANLLLASSLNCPRIDPTLALNSIQHHPHPHHLQAYEILIGKSRGKEVDSGSSNGWDFHDWYWKFSMRRRKRGSSAHASGAGADVPPPEALRNQWKQQLSGLKQRAATKSTQHSSRFKNGQKKDTRAANAAVWKSTTKNNRTTQTAQPKQPAADVWSALDEAAVRPSETVKTSATTSATSPAQEPESIVVDQSPTLDNGAEDLYHHRDHRQQHSTSEDVGDDDHDAQQVGRWQDALSAVHDLHLRNHHAVRTQVEAAVSQIVNFTRKLRSKLEPSEHFAHNRRVKITLEMNGSLHEEFTSTVQRMQRRAAQASKTSTASHAEYDGEHASSHQVHHVPSAMSHQQEQPQHDQEDHSYAHHTDAHSRKFADREHVESRLGHQLAGLKRKAALKRSA